MKQSYLYYQRAWIALFLALLIILWIGQYTNVDLAIEDYYYDPQLKVFPWHKTWFADRFMHNILKHVIIKFGQCLILFTILDAVFRFSWMTPLYRLQFRFVAIIALFVPSLISGLKQLSVLHCPFDVDRYGGDAPFYRLLDVVSMPIKAGHCFPAGHATSGLWLAAFCVFWLPLQPKKAVLVFFAGLSVGLLMGWVQQMRGQHFLFHTLWSAWLTSLLVLALLTAMTYKFAVLKPTSAAL